LTIAAGERYLRTERQPGGAEYDPFRARIEGLGDGGFLRVECAACGKDELIPPIGLLQGLALAAVHARARPGARCRECDQRGKVVLSITLTVTPGAGYMCIPGVGQAPL